MAASPELEFFSEHLSFRLGAPKEIRHKSGFNTAMRTALISLFAALLLFPGVASGSIGKSLLLHVKTYSSPSTEWQLEIDPSEREGRGKGTYRMAGDGKEVWRCELPFTLWDAAVTDDGVTVGFGYSNGENGYGGSGFLHMAVIDAAGKVRLDDRVKRQGSMIPDGSAEPRVARFILHAEQDRFIVQLSSSEQETWRVYRISTGGKPDNVNLRAASKVVEGEWHVIGAKPISGLPLVLTQGWRSDESENKDATFSILDFKGGKVWSVTLPGEYAIHDDVKSDDRQRDGLRKSGAILETREPGEFEIRNAASDKIVRFKVARDPKAETGWTAIEIARAKYVPPPEAKPKPKATPALVPPPLRLIDGFVLDDSPTTAAIRDITEFDIDGEGNFGFLRFAQLGGEYSFVLSDQQGKVISETALPMTKDTNAHCAWLTGSRWLITASEAQNGRKTRAWWFDGEQKLLAEIKGFECPSVEAVRGSGDGGFVALATFHQEFSSTDYLIRFDSLGKPLWRHQESGDDDPASLFSPEDIAVTSTKEIAVLANIRNTVQFYNLEGVYLRTTHLNKAWKREPNYPSGIARDAEGGIIVHDFNGKPPFVRMKADGSVRGEFVPTHADGRVLDARNGVRAAPDGKLWACDRESFAQLSDQGTAIRVIGSAPDDNKLTEITTVSVDPRGNTYAVDQRTGSVHVFGPDGKKIRVCKPEKDDFTGNLGRPHIAVAGDGGVMLEKQVYRGKARYLCFGPNGERLGFKSLGVDNISEKWYLQPGTSNMLVLGYEAVFLIDANGKLLKKIERQADRRWFENLSGAAFTDDGSFVIHSAADDGAANTFTFVSSDGLTQGTTDFHHGSGLPQFFHPFGRIGDSYPRLAAFLPQ